MSSIVEEALRQRLATALGEKDLLEEQVRSLQSQLGLITEAGFTAQCRSLFGLTPKESRLLRTLIAAPRATRQLLYESYVGTEPDGPELKIIDVMMCKVRAKLRPHEFIIETIWGEGYQIGAEARARLREMTGLNEAKPAPSEGA